MTAEQRISLLKPSAKRIYLLLADGLWHASQQIQEIAHALEYRRRLTEIRDIMRADIRSEDAKIGGRWLPGYRLVVPPTDLFEPNRPLGGEANAETARRKHEDRDDQSVRHQGAI